jgi:hypothetical protein
MSFNGLIRDHPSPARPHAAQPYLQQTQCPHGLWQANRAPHGHDPRKVLKAILAMFPTNSYTTHSKSAARTGLAIPWAPMGRDWTRRLKGAARSRIGGFSGWRLIRRISVMRGGICQLG